MRTHEPPLRPLRESDARSHRTIHGHGRVAGSHEAEQRVSLDGAVPLLMQ
jgi:hypothetical protein